jgi:hypothetical protein
MKKLWIGIIATVAMAAAVQAAVIVDFGAVGGATNIVTSNASTANRTANTYQLVSPADGGAASGYTGQAFYGAQSSTLNASIMVQDRVRIDGVWYNDPTKIDYIQLVQNFGGNAGTLTSMVAFEQEDWLNPLANELQSMEVRYENRGGVGTTASFLIQDDTGWYKSVETDTNTSTTVPKNWSLSVADLSWVAFSEFGLTAGSGAANVNDIQSAGVYFSAENDAGNNWAGTKIEYINVTAIPEPATLGMIASVGVGALFIRRRIMM